MELGWIVEDIVVRVRRLFGPFRALDWPAFLDLIGLQCRRVAELPVPALLYRGTILVRAGLDDWTTAWWIYHEAGHFLLHCGDQREWRDLACGDLILAKQERQAMEFATYFPDWGIDAAS